MQQSQSASAASSIFGKYTPLPGIFDEAVAPNGQPRAAWNQLVTQLETMGEENLRKRWSQAQAQIDRNGTTFNPHDDEGLVSRPWILDAIPMVLAESEWASLSSRLQQRSQVLEACLTDLFGEQRLLKDRVIPPELLYAHPAWYPAYQNLNVHGKRYLDYCVTDLARAPNGTWWATGDRTRSPFGLGYVLENRIVTTRMLSSVFRTAHVRRLAGFYATLKEQLRKLAPRFRENPRIVIWTKGPTSRGYFEDSYLARYLGYTLAEGDDLAVRDDRVQLLTLGGTLPVEVLLRRLDDDDCDAVELNPASSIGITALLQVLRDGRVAVANSLGSRLVESPAFLPFLPAISRHLLGEELQIPSVATWWCGEQKAREHVLTHLDRLLIRSAYRMDDQPPVVGHSLSVAARAELIAEINAQPNNFVAQEIVERSTTPVLTDQGVAPWYMGLRAFMVAQDEGFKTLPGGLARVSANSESLNFTMTAGERSQDVWVLSDAPVSQLSLLDPSTGAIEPRRGGAELPSRVADNFFWLGRYAERTGHTSRLLRTLFDCLESEDIDGPENMPLLRVLAQQGQIEPDHLVPELSKSISDVMIALPEAVLDVQRNLSLRSSVDNTVRTATQVRDRISVDMWRCLDRLNTQFVLASQVRPSAVDMLAVLENSLAELSAFSGLVAEGMTRTLGWQFLDLGVRIERCWQTSLLLKSYFGEQRNDSPESLEAILTVTDSLMTYRNRYLATFQLPVVLDLLITDGTNPRSIVYQLHRITEHLNSMPGNLNKPLLSPEQKLGISLERAVQLADIYDLSKTDSDGQRPTLRKLLTRLDEQLPKISDVLSSRFLIHAGLPRHFGSSEAGVRTEYGD